MDDISNLTQGKSEFDVFKQTLNWAVDFKQWIDQLKLDIPDKSMAVPDNWATWPPT